MKNRQLLPALVGLTVAWGGTLLLLSPAVRLLGPPERLATQLLGQLALWILLGVVVAIVVLWEKEPLAHAIVDGMGFVVVPALEVVRCTAYKSAVEVYPRCV